MLNRILSVLLLVQFVLCVLSAGFSPAILFAFALMIAAPVCCFRSRLAHGAGFLLLPSVTGMVLFQGLTTSPVFLGWLGLVVVASVIGWQRGSDKPQRLSAGAP